MVYNSEQFFPICISYIYQNEVLILFIDGFIIIYIVNTAIYMKLKNFHQTHLSKIYSKKKSFQRVSNLRIYTPNYLENLLKLVTLICSIIYMLQKPRSKYSK